MDSTPDGRRIGFAQNGEDIRLLRIFGDQPTGVWVDVGANHPVQDSVTKNFSDMGWVGINVEPVASFHELLMRMRPREINVHAALSDSSGTMIFHQNNSNLDLSTFEEHLASIYRQRGDEIVEIEVPVMRLADLCEQHLTVPLIDFLKIDTEGHELAVVKGHDFVRFPVRVLCAEATSGHRDEMMAWLAERGMRFAMFDGLNSWYVRAAEFDELSPKLEVQASPVLDWYHPWVYVSQLRQQDERIVQLERELAQIREARSLAPESSAAPTPAPATRPTFARRVLRRLRRAMS